MSKKKLLVYLDPGFLENRGHYMNFMRNIHGEARRRSIDIQHYVNLQVSEDYREKAGLIAQFPRTAYLSDTSKDQDVEEVTATIHAGFASVVQKVAALGQEGRYEEITYYMYTGHPTYLSSLAMHLSQHSHGRAKVTACVVLFYLSDKLCYGKDDGRYAAFLKQVSGQLDILDPKGTIQVGIDSDTALPAYSSHFSRPVVVVPFPHVQRAQLPKFPKKQSEKNGLVRITYAGYPQSKYGFHLVLGFLSESINASYADKVEFEIKLNTRLKEDDLLERWSSIKGRVKHLHIHEGYLDDSEYAAMIARADILLIPYNSQYNHDTSAVLVDALINGCIVVAAQPTWMAHVCRQHGSGAEYEPENVTSFIKVVREVVANIGDYKARVVRNLGSLGLKFSAEGLFDMLFPRWRVAPNVVSTQDVASQLIPDDGFAKKLLLPPVMTGPNITMPIKHTQEKDLQSLFNNLRKKLSHFNSELLPSERLPLAQCVAAMQRIATAWDERKVYQKKMKALVSDRKSARCIVIGHNRAIDPDTIRVLENEVLIVPQQSYRQFRGTKVLPTYLVLESGSFIQNNIDEINSFKGVIKFVPFHFAQFFENDEEIIFFNHQPRKSYPNGYDFSVQAHEITYTSCTVVGTAMQIAASLGFGKICLLGVDVEKNVSDYAELEKFYAEAERVSRENDIQLLNISFDTDVPHIQFMELQPFAATQIRARTVMEAAKSGSLMENLTPEEIAVAERALLERHPCPSAIYLPTKKFQGMERLSAIGRVVTAWNERQEIHKARLRAARERVRDRSRCFIIGNGPSLNKTNLDLLADEVTFATNGIFLKFPETSFRPTFFVVEDHLVGEDRHEEINQLRGFTKLAPYYLAYCLEDGEDVIYYNHRGRVSYPHGFDFSTNAEEITYTGCTVTFSCMQLAYYMGFKEIYLIGVDMSYIIPVAVQKSNDYDTEVLDMDIDDPNHFVPNYFGRGYRWHDPNVDKMEQAYIEAHKVTEANGVKIYNATIGGKCEVFDRVDYYSLFPGAVAEKPGETASPKPVTVSVDQAKVGSSGKKLAELYGYDSHAYTSRTVNEILNPRTPLTMTLANPRGFEKLLVAEIETVQDLGILEKLVIRVAGQPCAHSVHAGQSPLLIKIDLPELAGENLAVEIEPAESTPSVKIIAVSVIQARTHVAGSFPLSHFDGLRYLRENQDVLAAINNREILCALDHFNQVGRQEGRKFTVAVAGRPNKGYRYELSD